MRNQLIFVQRCLIILLMYGLAAPAAQAQDNPIQDIRAHYNSVQKQIKHAKEAGLESNFYSSDIRENIYGASWRAVGFYQRNIIFWHDDQPGFACEEFGGNDACHLQFIVEELQSSAFRWHTEYLYQSGELVFAYIVEEGQEFRYYWQNEQLIRAQIGPEVQKEILPEWREHAADAWNAGQQLRTKYITTFQ